MSIIYQEILTFFNIQNGFCFVAIEQTEFQ
jgi:hypothetical protein